MRISAFTKYGREAASTRQRVLQYLPSLASAGFHVDYHPLLSDEYVRSLASGGSISKLAISLSYVRRLAQLARGPDCDVVWVYAELFPYLPAAFERLVFRIGKPVVYDFDDAFFVPYQNKRWLERKLDSLIEGAAVCCCGNDYLRDYAARLNVNAMVLPTVVDTNLYVPVDRHQIEPLTIGWIGSPSTWRYVRPLLPMLQELCAGAQARLLVVGAGTAARADRFEKLVLRDWSEQSEVASIQAMDIGIMPLPDEPWARGKSGYKLVQYMACGLPVVASPVGANSQIVDSGRTGYLPSSLEQWRGALLDLIANSHRRREMGAAGRKRAVQDYSLATHAPRLVQVMRDVVGVKG